jgi:nitrate reductase gamma subunit
LFAAFCGLIVVGAITIQLDTAVSGDAGAWGTLIYYLTMVVGIAALILGTLGSLALIIRKVTDSTMSPYTRRIEYYNIFLVLLVFVTGFISWAAYDANFSTLREFMQRMIFFSDMPGVSTLTAIHMILLALLLAYVPFTNMTHFFAKHFTLNAVRWEDKPHLRGSDLERKLGPILQQPVSWSAPHMQDIHKWADTAKCESETEVSGRRAVSYEGGRSGYKKEDES